MCDCAICKAEVRAGTHISQRGDNAQQYARARRANGLTVLEAQPTPPADDPHLSPRMTAAVNVLPPEWREVGREIAYRAQQEARQPTPPAEGRKPVTMPAERGEMIRRAAEADDARCSAGSTPPAEGAPNRFRCNDDCGIVAVQEDGTCKHCGSDTTPVYVPPAEGETAQPSATSPDPTVSAPPNQTFVRGIEGPRPPRETPLATAEKHRCSGCGHRWEGPLKGAELCGDCWRKAQPVLHAPAPVEGETAEGLSAELRQLSATGRTTNIRDLAMRAHDALDRLTAENAALRAVPPTSPAVAPVHVQVDGRPACGSPGRVGFLRLEHLEQHGGGRGTGHADSIPLCDECAKWVARGGARAAQGDAAR